MDKKILPWPGIIVLKLIGVSLVGLSCWLFNLPFSKVVIGYYIGSMGTWYLARQDVKRYFAKQTPTP